MIEIESAGDGWNEWLEAEKKLDEQVKIVGDELIINIDYEYSIPLSDCSSPERVIHWVYHLTDKVWVSKPVIRKFIEVACNHHGISFT